MKIKTTRKNLKEIYKYIIKVGYCDIYYLLTFNYPVYYCTRVEGWAFDAHIIDYGILVSTGYAPIGNIDSLPYNIENKYNKLAQKTLIKFILMELRLFLTLILILRIRNSFVS